MKMRKEEIVDVVETYQPWTTHHARASSLALPIFFGGTIKQRLSAAESNLSLPTSASAPTLRLRSSAIAVYDSLVVTTTTTISSGIDETIGHIAAIAMRALFLFSLAVFLHALLGLKPLSLNPYPSQAEAPADYLLRHRDLRTAHEHFDHKHTMFVEPNGQPLLTHDYQHTRSTSESANLAWGGNTGGSDSGSATFEPFLGEDAVIHALRIYLTEDNTNQEESRVGSKWGKRNGRRQDVRLH